MPGQQSYADAIKAVLPVIPVPFLAFLPVEWVLGWLSLSFWLVLLFEKINITVANLRQRLSKNAFCADVGRVCMPHIYYWYEYLPKIVAITLNIAR